MTLREDLTGAEHDEIGELLQAILISVRDEVRSVDDAVAALRQAVSAALMQNPNFMNELRSAANA